MIFMSMTLKPQRGEIWLVDFDPSARRGHSEDPPGRRASSWVALLRHPFLRVVVPLTDWKPQYDYYSWFVRIPITSGNGLSKDSGADAFQLKSLSEARFARRLGSVRYNLYAITTPFALWEL